jgi:hypothetical protein
MNYLQAMHEKGILKEEYSPAIQKKIELLESFQEKDDISEADEEDFRILEQDLIKSIKKFNPEVYKSRKERMGNIARKTPKNEEKTDNAVDDKKIAKKLDELKERVQVKKELFEGSKVEESEPEPVEEVETEEIDDYKKTQTVKPKKMSTSFMLMGLGVFFLTWGGINLWRERR